MSYLPYQRYPGISRFRYLTIPARSGIFICHPYDTKDTPVFCDLGTYHTGQIRYFQKSYLRYPRVPRYGIPRVFTGVTPVNTLRDALPTAQQLVPTQHKCSVLLGAALLSLLTSTTIGCGVEVGLELDLQHNLMAASRATVCPTKLMLPVVRSPRSHFHFRYRWHS